MKFFKKKQKPLAKWKTDLKEDLKASKELSKDKRKRILDELIRSGFIITDEIIENLYGPIKPVKKINGHDRFTKAVAEYRRLKQRQELKVHDCYLDEIAR